LAHLKECAVEWGIEGWIVLTEKQLPRLLSSVGSRWLPTTSNQIERFFGTFFGLTQKNSGDHLIGEALTLCDVPRGCLANLLQNMGFIPDGIIPFGFDKVKGFSKGDVSVFTARVGAMCI